MIISFEHRFIFVAIPKTATHAFRAALRPRLAARDWEQCVLFEPRFFPVEPLAQIGHGHITCEQVRPYLLLGFWESSFRFCTVRNPYDRFVSCCYFMNRDSQRMQNDPLGTMKQTILDKQSARQILFRPQHEFVSDEDGRLFVDDVCRFEALQQHFDRICEKLQLPPSQLPRINGRHGGTSPPYRSSYDRELKEMVQAAYHKDFAMFDYPVDLEDVTACR